MIMNPSLDLLAQLLGDTPAAFSQRIDAAMARLQVDTSMPAAPSDAQWQALTGETFAQTQARLDTSWWDADGYYHAS